jgi:1-deoxy-D-xylulose 5-phosphate reductoisomerase
VDDRRHDGPVRCAVAPQLIGYQAPGFTSLAFQQPTKEAFRCILIATGLDENIDYIPVLVNRAPEILSLTLDSHEEFVQMPSVTQAALSSLECPGSLGAEFLTPLSDGLVRDYDPARRHG